MRTSAETLKRLIALESSFEEWKRTNDGSGFGWERALESSFEEWKRRRERADELRGVPLESSFEEWKHDALAHIDRAREPLESSFEEWKRGRHEYHRDSVLLLNLPLRNGNRVWSAPASAAVGSS